MTDPPYTSADPLDHPERGREVEREIFTKIFTSKLCRQIILIFSEEKYLVYEKY